MTETDFTKSRTKHMSTGTKPDEVPSTSGTQRLRKFSSSSSNSFRKYATVSHSSRRGSDMAEVGVMQPKSMTRPKVWSEEVEEAYRFQLAGYRDAIEYKQVHKTDHVDRWPHNGYVKKLVRRDGCFYYFNKTRECPDKEIHKTKMYSY